MVFDKVKEIIIEQLGSDDKEITMESNIQEDLGLDSLDVVDLIMSLEDEFDDLKIPDEDVEGIKTVGDVVKYIEKATNASEE